MTTEAPLPSGPTRSRTALLAIAAAGAAAVVAASVGSIHDPDLFHHLALGRHLREHGLSPAEPFLFPLLGAPLGVPPYWLGSLALYGWRALLGDGGLPFLPGVVGAALLLVLLADAAPRGEARRGLAWLLPAALPLTLAMEAFRQRASPRPEILGMLFLALAALAVRRDEEGRPGWLLGFPFLALLWTNVHPSLVAGLAVLAPHAAASLLRRGGWRERLLPLAVVVATLLVSGLNPSPANPLAEALRFARTLLGGGAGATVPGGGAPASYDAVRMMIVELAPPRLRDLTSPPGLLLLVTAASPVVAWRRPRLRELVAVLAFAVLFSRAVRFGAFLAVVCAPIAARNLGEAVARLPVRWAFLDRLNLGPRTLAGATLAALALVHPSITRWPPELSYARGLWPPAFPVRGADYLASIGFEGHLYDTFHFGGYLEWRGFHPYQDGRGTVLPGTLEASLLGPSNPATFAPLDERWRFDALLLQYPEDPEDARPQALRAWEGDRDRLVDRGQWSLVAFDDGGLLYLRRDGRYADRAARDEYRLARPANAGLELRRSTLAEALAEYDRAIREAPSCARCRHLYASIALAGGLPGDAWRALEPALARDARRMPGLLFLAGRAAEELGDPARARELYRRFLALGGEDPDARRGLARATLAGGDAPGAERALRPLLAAAAPDPDDVALAARIAEARGRPEEAAALLRAARPDERLAAARGDFDRALAAERAGDLQGAVRSYEASLAAYEPNPAAWSNLGFVLEKLGRLDDAASAQGRAAALDPSLAAAQFGLGSTLAAKGDRAGAAAAFRRYLALDPHGYWALKATQRLAELER